MRLPLSSALLLTTLGPATACIVEAPGGASAGERRQAVVAQVPPLSVKSGARLEDKVEVLGGTLQPARPRPGEVVRVTLYFKALAPVPDDYLVFVHVEAGEGRGERLNVDHAPAGGLYPTSQWKAGETIKDEFSFVLPARTEARSVSIWYGLWQQDSDTRMRLSNPDAVRNDGQHRLLLAQLPVGP